jgi:hypothetical protein
MINNQSSYKHVNLPAPYLPKLENNNDSCYTLVLDLDETLVHYKNVF